MYTIDAPWQAWQERCDILKQELMNHTLDHQKRQELQREYSYLSPLLAAHGSVVALEQALAETKKQEAQTSDPELVQLFKEEIEDLEKKIATAKQELELKLYPPDPLDNSSVFLEIRAGTGGQEAALFAADLLKMYTNYALAKQWHVSLVDSSTTDLGGIREAILDIQGNQVYGHLKHESGVHRVQRVPKTETSGRIHTSTATVAVLPESEEVDLTISPSDLRIDTYRAGGAGGQHVNRTDSAVRITHLPTNIVVACQDERSQHKNKAKAMKILKARLAAAQKEKQDAEQSQKRKEMVGGATRAEKVRTYNFPQNRVTDHQVDVTLKKLDMVMQGDLDEIIQALIVKDREDRKKKVALAQS